MTEWIVLSCAMALAGLAGYAIAARMFRMREAARSTQAERERERRATSVTLVVEDHIEKILDRAIARNLQRLLGAMDKRMGDLEIALKSALSYQQSDREDSRKDRDKWNSYERDQLAERIAQRQLIKELRDLMTDQRDICNRMLALLEPSK